MSWTAFLLVYLLGGLTFIPISLASVALYLYIVLPYRHDPKLKRGEADAEAESDVLQPGDDLSPLEKERDADKKRRDEGKPRAAGEPDVAAGYFAVCREYTPMGINAKPIERVTPAGSATVTAPSQSVYQTMYRSIFDRKATASPMDNGSMNHRPKRAGNVFYVVLRHGHLMLFDDDEQLEVRHVISLAHHDVSIYSGGEETPEGELYIKRNAIRLSRKLDIGDMAPDGQVSKPFYLFCDNCSAKEDFYFALLRNREHVLSTEKDVSEPLHFDVQDIISLIQRLHSTESHLHHTRWLNALIGRAFLAVYKTRDLENFIREKLTLKISRVKRPSFLSRILIRDIHPGNSAPQIFNPRLKEMNVDGECVVEADVRYTGNFRIEVATTARIDLGSHFKVREVDLVLSVALRKVEGHVLLKLKAPPSNRFWFAFQTMPKMEMSVEPIVSSRQITYTLILRQIENRIKEVVAESIVLPFWDDIPFVDTENKKWRGGIWAADNEKTEQPEAQVIEAPLPAGSSRPEALDISHHKESQPTEKSYSDIFLAKSPTAGLFSRKPSQRASGENSHRASTTSSDAAFPVSWPALAHSSPNVSVVQNSAKGEAATAPRDIAPSAAIATLSAVAGSPPKSSPPPASPARTLHGNASSANGASLAERSSDHTPRPAGDDDPETHTRGADEDVSNRRHTASSTESTDSFASTNGNASSLKSLTGSIPRGFFRQSTAASSSLSVSTATNSTSGGAAPKNMTTLAAVGNAAIQARQWGLNALQRHRDAKNEQAQAGGDSSSGGRGAGGVVDLSQPMGRGRPLPPIGTPLPPPERSSRTKIRPPPRKPVPPPFLQGWVGGAGSADGHEGGRGRAGEGKEREETGGTRVEGDEVSGRAPPPLPSREREEREGGGAEAGGAKAVGDEAKGRVPPPLPSRRRGGERAEGGEVKGRTPPPLPFRRRRGTAEEDSSEDNVLVVEAPVDSAPGSPSPGFAHGGASTEGAGAATPAHDSGTGAVPESAGAGEAADDDDGFAGWMDDTVLEDDGLETGPGDGPVGGEGNLMRRPARH